jgi:hypothetical protein
MHLILYITLYINITKAAALVRSHGIRILPGSDVGKQHLKGTASNAFFSSSLHCMGTVPYLCTMQGTADAKQLITDDRHIVEGAAPGEK